MLFAVVLLAALLAPQTGAQDGLARAKELYLAASYEEALTALESVKPPAGSAVALETLQYRAFCLLALQRQDEAKALIEEMYRADPFLRPSAAQMSPRVHGVFQEVRRAVLPAITQRQYVEAKELFEKKDPKAAAAFDRVITLLDDTDVKGSVSPDFRLVVTGFRDLSRALATPPPPVAPPRAATDTASPRQAPSPPPQPDVIVPPTAIARQMPRWAPLSAADALKVYNGQLEVSLDEKGNVTGASLLAPIYPQYDDALIAFAKRWRFRPATRNGRPIPYALTIPIQLQQ